MRIIVFVGPTLRPAAGFPDIGGNVEWRPPAERGDIYHAAKAGKAVIGLIDGYFRHVPAPQHKEILWAIGRGNVVFGAASMGALRAAELWPFGMIGVGRIFEAYVAKRLCRDDEVAIEHGPEELGYAATSEALVNIRYTFARAVEREQLAEKVANRCIEIAAATFYPGRSFRNLVREYNHQTGADTIGEQALVWLEQNRVDQKAADARELLRAISRFAATSILPPQAPHAFEDTMYFSDFRTREDNPFLRDCL